MAASEEQHLGWTKKQGYILTGGGKAETFYTAERGFPFEEKDLPHYHLLKGDTHSAFKPDPKASSKLLVAGAWNRPLFAGGWKHSSDKEETVYNVQTNNLFIDFRVPKTRGQVLTDAASLEDMNEHQLRLYARQHIFAGITLLKHEKDRPVATRHHFIDWNFVGIPRSRPNKWWIETADEEVTCWKEYSYATDHNGQHYYFEQWDRLEQGIPEPMLALRISPSSKRKSDETTKGNSQDDGVFVLAGDHFSYVLSRKLSGNESHYPEATSLVDLVDAAIDKGDLETARSYLTIQGGHGLVSKHWKLDCAIPPQNEGKDIADVGGGLEVVGTDLDSCSIVWKGYTWDIYDCSFESMDDLKGFLSSSKTP